ncbi:hypothetical protein H5410_052123 [Solanum commersonii]|uniref:MBD domain-containing protein n=1 Tax=Solanum commersonii TaxID=4109 RepID=A0A9J5X339_SOLCO|nr:hypothetical protein H5410_052123 [Solanum commersonii]
MTKADAVVSSIPLTIVTSNDFYNDGIPSDPLLPLGSYIDVELDVRVETATPKNSDVPNDGKVSDIKRKITPTCQVNPDRPKWLPNNWTFETKVRSNGASAGQKDRYYFESVTKSKFRSKPQVDDFLKTGLKRGKLDPNRDAVHHPKVLDANNGSESIPSLQKWSLVKTIKGMEETTKSALVIKGSFERVNLVNADISSILPIIVTSDDLCNDDTPSDSLLPSRTYIDVLLDVRVEITTINKGDVPNEGKVSDVTISKLQIQRKIMHMHQLNLDTSKGLLENWRFGIKVRTTGATT